MELYYKSLMSVLRFIARDKVNQTWTFHKGCLRILGNDWVKGSPRKRFALIRVLWTTVYPTLYVLLLLISTILTVKKSIQMEKETTLQFIRSMNGYIVSIAYVCAMSKAVLFKLRGAALLKLMDMVDDLGDFDDVGQPHRDRTLLSSCLYMALLFLIPANWTIYFIFIQQAIPYPTDFPWDEETSLGYFASFSTDFVTAVFCAALHSVYDTMFPVVVGALSGHVASLKCKLIKIGRQENREKDGNTLRKCLEIHVSIQRIIEQMNSCYRLMFLTQTVYTVLHACVIIYQVMQVSELSLAIINTSPILASAYSQMLLYCYYGQLLTTSFDELKDALYDNEWYTCSLKVKKRLNLMTIMADRSIKLQCYGITFAGHATFLSSLQDSVSYYLILKTLTTEE